MIKVNVAIHTDDEYDRVCKMVRASTGWVQMDMTDNNLCGDPLADFAVYFDNEKNAMWFKLQIGQ